MSAVGDVVIGLAMVIGLIGTILPVLPGLLLIMGALIAWALVEGTTVAWIVTVVGALLAGAGTVYKYLVPKRRLEASGIPPKTVILATVVAVVGFFVLPVIGAPIGFIATVYLFEKARLAPDRAWPATKQALGAIVTSTGIELGIGAVIAMLWLGAVILG